MEQISPLKENEGREKLCQIKVSPLLGGLSIGRELWDKELGRVSTIKGLGCLIVSESSGNVTYHLVTEFEPSL